MNLQRPSSRQVMPPTAKRVFQGVIFDTYQWEEMGYDGKIKVFEKLKRADTVVVIPITEDGEIMYSFQEQPGKTPFVGSIGGRVDEGEDVLEAAKRELMEESGYEAKEWILLEAIQPTSKIDWCIWTFIAKGCHKVREQELDGAEKIEVRFASFEQFQDIVINQDFSEERLRTRFLEAKLDPQKMEELEHIFS